MPVIKSRSGTIDRPRRTAIEFAKPRDENALEGSICLPLGASNRPQVAPRFRGCTPPFEEKMLLSFLLNTAQKRKEAPPPRKRGR